MIISCAEVSFFSGVEIPIKHSSLYNKLIFFLLVFLKEDISMMQELYHCGDVYCYLLCSSIFFFFFFFSVLGGGGGGALEGIFY